MFRAAKCGVDDGTDRSDLILKELEVNLNSLGENNIQLRKEKDELGAELKTRTGEKEALQKDLDKLKTDTNNTEFGLKLKLVSR